MLGKISDPDLRVYAVWVPILTPQPADELQRNAHREAQRQLDDKRVVNFVDPGAASTRELAPVLGIGSYAGKQVPAWDVYMVYDAGQAWTPPPGAAPNAPPKPAFWQHQLSHGAPPDSSKLDGDYLRQYVTTFAHAAAK